MREVFLATCEATEIVSYFLGLGSSPKRWDFSHPDVTPLVEKREQITW